MSDVLDRYDPRAAIIKASFLGRSIQCIAKAIKKKILSQGVFIKTTLLLVSSNLYDWRIQHVHL